MNIPGNPWASRSLPPPPTEALFGFCDFIFLSSLFGRPAYKRKIVLEFMIAFIVFRCPPPPHFSLREDNLVLVLLLSVLVPGKRLTSEVIAVWMIL